MPEQPQLDQLMSISRADFLRSLSQAAEGYEIEDRGADISATLGERRVAIRFEERPPLVIASLSLPRAQVRVELAGYQAEEAARFMQRFELCFRRGGG